MIEAKVIKDSIGRQSPRFLTIRATNPKFIHQESLRHRLIYVEDALRGDFDFSFSVSSARAIPTNKLWDEVADPHKRAAPVKWGAEKKGMSPGDELIGDALFEVQKHWDLAAQDALYHARHMAEAGAHKSIVNRVIEPYIHVHCLMSATAPGWLNFFGLRLDKHADPTLQALAEECWKCWNESQPTLLQPNEWHLPFIDYETWDEMWPDTPDVMDQEAGVIKVSVARCARLSYMSFETGKRSTVEEDIALYDRLITSKPIHASPAEHQATTDTRWRIPVWNYGVLAEEKGAWMNKEQAGNLGPGWRQYRKMLPGEAIADIPEAYL